MSYRKIVVDGKQYEYVIGKDHTKIKGVGVFSNSIFDATWVRPAFIGGPSKSIFVTPGMIADLIQGKKPRKLEKTQTPIMTCEHGVTTPFSAADPYESEIYGEHRPMIACTECVEEQSWYI